MRIVCFSNSFKEGGRCLAGIQIDENLHIVKQNNRPKWIRPVCNTPHEEVPVHLVNNINYYDVIEFINDPNYERTDYQSENALIQGNSIHIIQRVSVNNMNALCDNDNYSLIFGNRGKAVHPDAIERLNYSLMMISVETFEVVERNYQDQIYPQIRLAFQYNGNNYNLPITDPVFLHQYQLKPNLLENIAQIYLVLSLGIEFEGWYSKLIATILY